MDHMSPGDEMRIGPVFFFHHGGKDRRAAA
jgi:hypothetical protein